MASHSLPGYLIPHATELVQPHALDWPNAGLLRHVQSLIMGMVLWGASMVYGFMLQRGTTSFPRRSEDSSAT
jgi:hypothetical protein